jgi:uncharacterized OsmC-like protein
MLERAMTDHREHHVTVHLDHDYQFVAGFDDVPGAAPMRFDEPAPLGEDKAPSAAAVLGAAVGNCLAASFTHCLKRARMDVRGMTAHITTRVAKNERGRLRIEGIDVALEPDVAADAARVQRCSELFEDFCIVTASVRQGIPVRVSLPAAEHKSAA